MTDESGQDGVSHEHVPSGTHSVLEMLRERNLGLNAKPEHLPGGDFVLMKNFSEQSGYDAFSTFGQLASLIVAEETSRASLSGFMGKTTRGNNPKPEHVEAIKAWQSTLSDVRTVRREVSQKIFGDQAEVYEQRLKDAFFKYGGSTTKVRRDALRSKLYADVRTNFPLTSR